MLAVYLTVIVPLSVAVIETVIESPTDAELLETLIVVVPCAIATILNAKTITAIAAKLTALLNNLFIINYLP